MIDCDTCGTTADTTTVPGGHTHVLDPAGRSIAMIDTIHDTWTCDDCLYTIVPGRQPRYCR